MQCILARVYLFRRDTAKSFVTEARARLLGLRAAVAAQQNLERARPLEGAMRSQEFRRLAILDRAIVGARNPVNGAVWFEMTNTAIMRMM